MQLYCDIKCWLGQLMLFFSLVLIGCGSTVDTSVSAQGPSSSLFKVAMILPGAIDDGKWNTVGYQGLQLIQQELGVQIDYRANVRTSQAEAVLRGYATENYTFIIAHGGQFLAAIETVAEAFPRVKFVIVTQYAGNNKNLGAVSFRDEEMGYLCGVVAGLKTKTNQVAYVGGEQALPYMVKKAAAFELGATSVNPNVEVSAEWIGGGVDENKARDVAQALLAAQVDVFIIDANRAGLVVYQAAQEADVHAIGWVTDQHDAVSDTVLTNCIQRTPLMLLEATKLVQRGRWEGKQYRLGLRDGVQDLAPFYGLLTAEEEAKINQIKADIISGKIIIAP